MAAITPRQRTGWATANFVVLALALIPVLWLVSLSFKTPTAVLDPSSSRPSGPGGTTTGS
jgi:hypothetical protein